MRDPEEAWNEVGDRFKKLGNLLKEHYDERGDADEEVAGETEPTKEGEEVKEALHTLADSINRAAESLGDAFRNPTVKEEAKEAARSFADAMGATFAKIGDEFKKMRDKQSDIDEDAMSEVEEAMGEGLEEELAADESPDDDL